MILETFKNFNDFELLDTGNGYRLERWGDAVPRTGVTSVTTGAGVILQRPDPQIIWEKSLPDEEWDKAWAIFKTGSDEEKGKWDIKKSVPKDWAVTFKDIRFVLKLSPFKHTGLFAEQAAQWEWMENKLKVESVKLKVGNSDLRIEDSSSAKATADKQGLRILNLFGYTGGATMVLAKAGCFVTHVDASKPAITWANENYKLNFPVGADLIRPWDGKMGSSPTPGNIRWILDDALKFAQREIKRGSQYDGIIMDPPAFGHSPTGKTWKFNRDLPELLTDCVTLLSPNAKFLIVNGYATNSSALALKNVLEDALKNHPGAIEFGELCLKQKNERMISTGIFARWSV